MCGVVCILGDLNLSGHGRPGCINVLNKHTLARSMDEHTVSLPQLPSSILCLFLILTTSNNVIHSCNTSVVKNDMNQLGITSAYLMSCQSRSYVLLK